MVWKTKFFYQPNARRPRGRAAGAGHFEPIKKLYKKRPGRFLYQEKIVNMTRPGRPHTGAPGVYSRPL
jgi:hypothetical protein